MKTDYQYSKQYLNYMQKLESELKVLDEKTKNDILNELASHVYESMCRLQGTALSDEDCLNNVLTQLGSPTKIAQLYVTESQLKSVLKKSNPFEIIRQTCVCIFRTGKYLVSGILYLFSVTFFILSILKIFIPDSVGFFYNNESFFVGYCSETDLSMPDILGYWFILIGLIISCILYLIGTILIKRNIIKKQQ